jgi:hypothetical protein
MFWQVLMIFMQVVCDAICVAILVCEDLCGQGFQFVRCELYLLMFGCVVPFKVFLHVSFACGLTLTIVSIDKQAHNIIQ